MYSYKSRVRYSEVGSDGKLGIPAIVNYFQDCSTFQLEDIGIEMDQLTEEEYFWFLSSWQIIVNRNPNLGEPITIQTWSYGYRGCYGYRNFVMLDEQNEKLACANSVWIHYNMKKQRPERITPEQAQEHTILEKLPMDYADRKIKMKAGGMTYESFPVKKYHIDTNQHVNNGKYIQIAKEFIPDGLEIHQMRAEYKKAAKYKDIIVPVVQVEEGNVFQVALNDVEENPYVIVEFVTKEA